MFKNLCRRVSIDVIVGGLFLGWLGHAVPAQACSTLAPDPVLRGYPTEGDVDVPTNVVPYYFMPPEYGVLTSEVPGTFVLETVDGEMIPMVVRNAQLYVFEIVPEAPLQPQRRYRLRAHWVREATMTSFEDQLEFTTGDGPRTGPIAPPVATLQTIDVDGTADSCGYSERQRSCVTLQGDAAVEYQFVDEFEQRIDAYLVTDSFFTTNLVTSLPQGTNFRCVYLRTRAADATFSEAVTLCGNDSPVIHIKVTEDTVSCDDRGLHWPSDAIVSKQPSTTSNTFPVAVAGGAAPEPSEIPESFPHDADGCSAVAGSASSTQAGSTWGWFTSLCVCTWYIRRRRNS